MNRLSLAALAAFTTLAVLAAPAGAVVAPEERPLPNIDVRTADGGPTTASVRRARATLERSLGDEGTVSNDRITGGARLVARTDGFLTGRRAAAPTAIALDFVRSRPDVFGLDPDDLDRLRLTSRKSSPGGVTHLAYTQTYLGVASYDNVLLANVAGDGRLLNIGGAAVSDLRVASVTPDLTAGAALALAREGVGGSMIAPRSRQGPGPERPTRFPNGDTARLTLFNDGATTRLAWRLEVTGEHDYVYEIVIDATSGRVLKRRSLTEFATARVHRNHPGAVNGGAATAVTLDPAWLNAPVPPASPRLSGNNAHAYADLDATDTDPANPNVVGPTAGDAEIPPSSAAPDWDYPIAPFSLPGCPPAGCTWNPADPNTRALNRNQATTQLFYFVNTFHDHLRAAPIGFTHAMGNFELNDPDGPNVGGRGGDPVMAETDNYLNPDAPAQTSTNNASMTTRIDGTPPRLEMFLFTNPSLNAADTADVVYHEYAHGLTNRSVGSGVGLDADQSRALGEAWSDWYALDYLEEQNLRPDALQTPGEMTIGAYLIPGGFRTQGADCRVAVAAGCPGKPGAHAGGYTLGDMGTIAPTGFEVHADGEIWLETLWDLRRALRATDLGEDAGTAMARELVTSGLRLAPNNPSFLEARDAILLADREANDGAYYDLLWDVFRARGMGFNAARTSSAATSAVANFDAPPRLVPDVPRCRSTPCLAVDGSTTLDDGPPPAENDGDDVPEPGETIGLTERLFNPHATGNAGIAGVLSSSAPGVTVSQPAATWPDIPARGSGANLLPFEVTLAPGASCDTTALMSLAMTTTNPGAAFTIPLRIPIGSKSSADVPERIPGAGGAAVSTLTFDGAGTVNDLEVRIPRLAHTWVGDLVVTLESPAGTIVTLMDRPGAGSEGASGNDFVNLVLDDDAATAIEDIPATNPSGGYTGRFRPAGLLSGFDGEPRQGDWTLTITDEFPGDDSGTLHDWGIRPAGDDCPNRAPDAADDAYAVAGGDVLDATISVLANDSDPDGNQMTAELLSAPAHGTVALTPGGTFTYTPVAGYRGADSFTYRARDDGTPSMTAEATVHISVGNRAPTAADDSYAVAAGGALSGSSVLANDSDPNGDALAASLESAPAHGTLTLAPNGTFTYTPVAGFTGRDAFVYRASDGSLSSSPATATITVAAGTVSPPPAPPPQPPPPPPTPAPAKLQVLRAGVTGGRLDVLASITARATGNVRVSYRSGGRTTSFDTLIRGGRISFRRVLPRAQRSKPTGIFTLSYAGSSTVLADSVRLRAARGKARLVRTTSLIDKTGRLRVSGTITPRARGVVRIRLGYVAAGGSTEFKSYTTKISRGRWSLAAALPAAAARSGGQLSIQFTGYEPLRIRGEQLAKAVSPPG